MLSVPETPATTMRFGVPSIMVPRTVVNQVCVAPLVRVKRLRLELTQAELEERRGNLLRRDEVERATFARFRRVRDAVLRVPVQLAAAVAANTDPAECRRVMNDALRDALLGEGADA